MVGMVGMVAGFLLGRSQGNICFGRSGISATFMLMMVEGEEEATRRDEQGKILSSMFHWERLLRRLVWTVRGRFLEIWLSKAISLWLQKAGMEVREMPDSLGLKTGLQY